MAQAELAAVTAMLERTDNELGYATIISPMDGIVLSRAARKQLLNSGKS
jgi:multidrug efflux pump subunit AcrA (membrane-fusion protein)